MECLSQNSKIIYAQQIVDIDWYLSKPLKNYDPSYCYLSNSSIKHVPVLRIFGSTPSRQSACLHIHGVFPYLYAPLPAGIDPSPHWLREINEEIDSGINRIIESKNKNLLHVYDIKLITGRKFYGYHPDRSLFLQIFLYDPSHIRILADLLLTGNILDTAFQPHEAHIPFSLQFLIDYNLYGMSFIYLDKLQFRVTFPISDGISQSPSTPNCTSFSSRVWNYDLKKEQMHSEPRHSNCQLEADTLYHSILNPSLFSSADNPGIAMIWEDEKVRLREQGLTPDISLPLEIERQIESSTLELNYLKKLEEIIRERLFHTSNPNISHPSNVYFNQKEEREPFTATLLLSPPSLAVPGDGNIISILTELELGTEMNECRLLNIDGHTVSLPSILFSDSQKCDVNNEGISIHESIGDNLEKINNSFQESQIQSFNLSLIRHSFISAASDLLPSECQGFIFNSISQKNPQYDLAVLEDMIKETHILSQPLNFDSEISSNLDTVLPFQLDGTGRRGRPRKKVFNDSNSNPEESSRSKIDAELKTLPSKIQKSSMKHSTTLQYSNPSTYGNIPLIVKISTPGLILKDYQHKFSPFTKYPVLKISRINLDSYLLSIQSQVKYKKQKFLREKMVCDESMDIALVSDSVDYDIPNTSLELNSTEAINTNFSQNISALSQTENISSTTTDIFELDQSSRNSIDYFPMLEGSKDLNDKHKCSVYQMSSQNNKYQNALPNSGFVLKNQLTPEEEIVQVPVPPPCELSTILYSNDVITNSPGLFTEEKGDTNMWANQHTELENPAQNDRSVKNLTNLTEINELELISISPQATPDSKIISQESSNEYLSLDENNDDNTSLSQNISIESSNINDNSRCIPIMQQIKSPTTGNEHSETQVYSGYTSPSDSLKQEKELISTKMLDPTSIDSAFHDRNIIGTDPIDYKCSVSPISDNSGRITDSSRSSQISSKRLSSNSGNSHLDSPQNSSNPLLNDVKITNHKTSKYSSVSSESDTDNLDYELSNSLIETQGKKQDMSCFEHKIVSNENIDVFTKDNAHSTPLLRQMSDISAVIPDPFSPICQQDSQLNFFQQPLSSQNNSPNLCHNVPNQKLSFSDNSENLAYYTNSKLSSLNENEQSEKNADDNFSPPHIPSLSHYSQIEGPTTKNSQHFKFNSHDLYDISMTESRVGEYLTLMSVEILVRTRDKLFPNPQFDSVLAICYHVYTHKQQHPFYLSGIISLNDTWDIDDLKKIDSLALSTHNNVIMTHISSEIELFQEFINTVLEYDPDICVGYEYQFLSWGYLIERASLLQIDLLFCLSRAQPPGKMPRTNLKEKPYNFNYSDPKIVGRILINLWRICKHEITLNNYSFENVSYHVLHRRFPHFSYDILTKWYTVFPSLHRWSSLQYYFDRAKANIQIIDALNVIGRTSELARLFGIEFYNVLSRGTQYRVESMMIRLLKRHEYIVVSPSVRQRARMLPPSEIPLVMEPQGNYFTDPVVVLDFQSLYPSIIIANNYCYSTCLGRLENLKKEGNFSFGATDLSIPPHILANLKPCDVNISPNGVVFVKPHIRKGMLPIMLEEILKTRIMVKQAINKYKEFPFIQNQLNIRQIGLKLIANVTYGYTQANLSGRMPCVEIGDSVVAKARETLERAIQLVESSTEWNARVVYGDTDSLFVHFPGYSRDEAFDISYEIMDMVTKSNLKPIKLKLEKVYQPCILISKKRYVGFAYDSKKQTIPLFDPKGIETVRRDSCPIVSKLMERSLKIFFRTDNINEVKKYVIDQCSNLFRGNISLQDFIFAREFRGIHGYQPGIITHSLHLARQKVSEDLRSEPRIGSRIPYLYIYENHDSPLIDLVRTPEQVIADSSLIIHMHYYLHNHIIPALGRAFDKVGANVNSWIHDIPRKYRPAYYDILNPIEKTSISQFVDTNFCIVCNREGVIGLCHGCATNSQRKHSLIGRRYQHSIARIQDVRVVCKACHGDTKSKECESIECHIYYKRMKLTQQLNFAKRLSDLYLCHTIDFSF